MTALDWLALSVALAALAFMAVVVWLRWRP